MVPISSSAHFVRIALVFALCLILTGCAKSKITKANFDSIKNDMTLDDVEAILGEGTPTGGDGSVMAAQAGVALNAGARSSSVQYVWESGKAKITVTFRGGKVTGKTSEGL
jgi:hypothetical protein